MPPAILIVEPYESFRSQLLLIAEEAGWEGIACDTFAAARVIISSHPLRMMATNVRLGQFNGIQLAYLAKLRDPTVAVIVYASDRDMGLVPDASDACCFFERESYIPYALGSYLSASTSLPKRDRRDPRRPDRRAAFRGGRRATDLSFLHPPRLEPPAKGV